MDGCIGHSRPFQLSGPLALADCGSIRIGDREISRELLKELIRPRRGDNPEARPEFLVPGVDDERCVADDIVHPLQNRIERYLESSLTGDIAEEHADMIAAKLRNWIPQAIGTWLVLPERMQPVSPRKPECLPRGRDYLNRKAAVRSRHASLVDERHEYLRVLSNKVALPRGGEGGEPRCPSLEANSCGCAGRDGGDGRRVKCGVDISAFPPHARYLRGEVEVEVPVHVPVGVGVDEPHREIPPGDCPVDEGAYQRPAGIEAADGEIPRARIEDGDVRAVVYPVVSPARSRVG